MRLPALATPPRPMLTGESMRSEKRLPADSTTAWSACSDTSLTPWKVSPTATVLGGAPFTMRMARLPMEPVSVTESAACAPMAAAEHSTAARSAFMRGSVAEVVEGHRHVGHVLLDEGHGGLQVVALGTGDAHGVALDRGLHLELAVLDD